MLEQELLKCPDCGSDSLATGQGNDCYPTGHEFYWRYCRECGCTGPRSYSRDEAANLWNIRAVTMEAGLQVLLLMPKGHEFVRIGTPDPGEYVLSGSHKGGVHKVQYRPSVCSDSYVIVRPKPEPKPPTGLERLQAMPAGTRFMAHGWKCIRLTRGIFSLATNSMYSWKTLEKNWFAWLDSLPETMPEWEPENA